jgi:hypothetical protein
MVMALLKGFGWDDPEEEIYEYLGEQFSPAAENIARHGLAGTAGFTLKGSLSIGAMDLPTSLGDILGAPGSVISDTLYTGPKKILQGDISKGIETMLPTGLSNPVRAYREATEGLTTGKNAPVFYGKDPVKLSPIEAYYRAFSLNPTRIATIREKQWSERQIEAAYREESAGLYARYKRLQLSGNPDMNKVAELLAEIEQYNLRAKRHGISPITRRSIRTNIRRNFRPSRREREREIDEESDE